MTVIAVPEANVVRVRECLAGVLLGVVWGFERVGAPVAGRSGRRAVSGPQREGVRRV